MKKFSVRNENEIRIIHLENLVAITVEDYFCTFYIENESCFSCTQPLKEIASLLPDFFIQINRNCIVNAEKIKAIDLKNKKTLMQNNITFSISFRNLKVLKEYFEYHTFKNKKGK